MEGDNQLAAFAVDLQQEVILAAEVEGDESLRSEAFTSLLIDDLIEAGEIDDGTACYYRVRGVEISGYGLGHGGETLNLFVTIYRGVGWPETVTRTEVETSFKRLSAFLELAVDGLHRSLEESSPVFDMAATIHDGWESIDRVRFFLLTDGVFKGEYRSGKPDPRLDLTYNIWDLQRLFRYVTSGQRREPIHIDFVDTFGEALPCLAAPASGDYQAYLAILPGRVVDSIYTTYGPRLLELNVRSFLQIRGKINQGIRKTILEAPGHFLAYNNGLSATAASVEVVRLPAGGLGIKSIDDLQIVNGGQTTASIHSAVRRDRADVSEVYVQAKLTVIGNDRLDQFVPLISRFANSQNKIDDADFSANDPYHVRMEELSRTVWAPPRDGTQRQTKWFYERARGQYQDALGRAGTPAKQRELSAIYPKQQKFAKTDLAKFENTWDQLPHLVSQGAQKNFREFTLRLQGTEVPLPEQETFQQLVAKAILFRRAEKIVSAKKFGGYRANIVTYSLAYLSFVTEGRLDLDSIWARQDIALETAEAIGVVSDAVNSVITSPPSGGNVTEWCKKPACWARVQNLRLNLSVPSTPDKEAGKGSGLPKSSSATLGSGDKEDESLSDGLSLRDPTVWFAVSKWAKEAGELQPWQRSLAYSIGRVLSQGRNPSAKQARQGVILMRDAERIGFDGASATPPND